MRIRSILPLLLLLKVTVKVYGQYTVDSPNPGFNLPTYLSINNPTYGNSHIPWSGDGAVYLTGTSLIYRIIQRGNSGEIFVVRGNTGFVGINSPWPSTQLSLGANLANSKLALYDGGNDKYGFGIQGGQLRLHIGNPGAKFSFLNGEAGSEIMTVHGNGSVVITNPANTPAPSNGFLLTVKGKVLASEVKVSVAALGDYIFSPAYRLRPLSEVETFVKQNGHLPEVPSAAEVARDGMNLGEMENTLLKKIEELTLYVIEQQKQIQALQEQHRSRKRR